jgi:hypothetical protein
MPNSDINAANLKTILNDEIMRVEPGFTEVSRNHFVWRGDSRVVYDHGLLDIPDGPGSIIQGYGYNGSDLPTLEWLREKLTALSLKKFPIVTGSRG